MYEINILSEFSAAHQLLNYQGSCSRLHGHNWQVEVTLRGDKLDKSGILFDFRKLKAALRDFTNRLDHRFLNELPELKGQSPSAEIIANLIAEHILKTPLPPDTFLYRVRVGENARSFASYYP